MTKDKYILPMRKGYELNDVNRKKLTEVLNGILNTGLRPGPVAERTDAGEHKD